MLGADRLQCRYVATCALPVFEQALSACIAE